METLKKHIDVKTVILLLTIVGSALGNMKVQEFKNDQLEKGLKIQEEKLELVKAQVGLNCAEIKLVRQGSVAGDEAVKADVVEVKDDLKTIKSDIKLILQKLH